jgi:hypothetical protein
VWLLDAPEARKDCRWFVVTLTQCPDSRYELRFKPVTLMGTNGEDPDFEPDDHSVFVTMGEPDTERWFEIADPKLAVKVVQRVLNLIVEENAELRLTTEEGSSLNAIVQEVSSDNP